MVFHDVTSLATHVINCASHLRFLDLKGSWCNRHLLLLLLPDDVIRTWGLRRVVGWRLLYQRPCRRHLPDVCDCTVSRVPDVFCKPVLRVPEVCGYSISREPDVCGCSVSRVPDVFSYPVSRMPDVCGCSVSGVLDVIVYRVSRVP